MHHIKPVTGTSRNATSASAASWSSTLDLVRERARSHGAREAVVDQDVRLTFAQLSQAVEESARAFISSGIAVGDRVAIWAPNSHEWIIAALGLQAAGGVLVPLNTRFKGAEAADILARSNARMLFTVRDFLGVDYPALLREHLSDQVRSCEIVIFRGLAGPDLSWRKFLSRAEATDAVNASARYAAVGPDAFSDIIFTSGTTGRSKGAMFRHAQMLGAVARLRDLLEVTSEDCYLVIPPFFHTFGYRYGFIFCLVAAARCILLQTLDLEQLEALVEREHVSFLPGPPTLFHSLLERREGTRKDLSSLSKTLVGAASIPVALIHRMRRELPFRTILTAYGLTESCGVASICRPGDDDEVIATTSGRAFPDVELRIVDSQGGEQKAGERGEVWIRSPFVMAGYLDDPEQSAAAITPDGWLRSGDIGVKDEQGNLRIVDRIKDMFIVGGFNAYPAEIEGLMLRNPNIAQVAVVGAPEERLGEVGVAFVELHQGAHSTAEDIIDWCRNNMANFKVPRFVIIGDKLPTNASGKVLKSVLRERARASIRAIVDGRQNE